MTNSNHQNGQCRKKKSPIKYTAREGGKKSPGDQCHNINFFRVPSYGRYPRSSHNTLPITNHTFIKNYKERFFRTYMYLVKKVHIFLSLQLIYFSLTSGQHLARNLYSIQEQQKFGLVGAEKFQHIFPERIFHICNIPNVFLGRKHLCLFSPLSSQSFFVQWKNRKNNIWP